MQEVGGNALAAHLLTHPERVAQSAFDRSLRPPLCVILEDSP